jgi:agmatine deiminase
VRLHSFLQQQKGRRETSILSFVIELREVGGQWKQVRTDGRFIADHQRSGKGPNRETASRNSADFASFVYASAAVSQPSRRLVALARSCYGSGVTSPSRNQSHAVGNNTLAERGYRMPAEWEPHESTWLAWPHFRGDWPGKFDPIPWVYAEIIRNLARHEFVDLIVNDAQAEKRATRVLDRAAALHTNVRFHRWPSDRVWLRDSGCTFVVASKSPTQQSLLGVKWKFNAWAKYPNYKLDEKIGSKMAKAVGAEEVRAMCGKDRIVLEGGSIDVNGQGTLLTTEECLLSDVQQRNPSLRREDYAIIFSDYLGIHKVIWLGAGIAGDDTHGHIDDITRFVSPDTVVTMVERNQNDINHAPLAHNLQRLQSASDQNGRRLRIVEVPMPAPVVFEGRRLPASYANFYVANGCVLAPVFNDANDRVALNALAELFPSREIIPIYSGDLIWGFGAMHCMTQQQPRSNQILRS